MASFDESGNEIEFFPYHKAQFLEDLKNSMIILLKNFANLTAAKGNNHWIYCRVRR
jgi:hypothetical protein